MPEIEERLNYNNKNMQALDNIEQMISMELPKDFRALYTKYNGEKNEPYTGMFFEFVHKMLIKGKCYVNKEEEINFEFESGHFFNVMKDILEELSDNVINLEIELPQAFWREKFGSDKVPVSILKKQTSLFISKGEQTMSLEPVVYMEKLRELIIHDCVINDFEKICDAKEFISLCSYGYTGDFLKD